MTPRMPVTARILLVWDNGPLRSILARALSEDGYEVFCVAALDAALDRVERRPVDVVLLEDSLHCDGGWSRVLRRLRECGHQVPLIVLGHGRGGRREIEALDLGADEYLAKPFTVDLVEAHVRSLMRRAALSPYTSLVETCGDVTLYPATRTASRSGFPMNVSHIEFALLYLLVRNRSRILTFAEIWTEVWGDDTAMSRQAISSAVHSLREKLECGGRPRILFTAHRVGYALYPPAPEARHACKERAVRNKTVRSRR